MKRDQILKIIIGLLVLLLVSGGIGAFLFAAETKQGVTVIENQEAQIKQEPVDVTQELNNNNTGNILYENKIDELQDRIDNLEYRLQNSENEMNKVRNQAGIGIISFLFGAFCALWAQNTGRSAWLWFFAGLFFNVLAVIVLLVKNSEDKAAV